MSQFDEFHLTHEPTEAQRGLNDLLRVTVVTEAEARPRLRSLFTCHQSLWHLHTVPDTHRSSPTHSYHLALPILGSL